jgi:hypothetical protein
MSDIQKQTSAALFLGALFVGSVLYADNMLLNESVEHFGNADNRPVMQRTPGPRGPQGPQGQGYPAYPTNPKFYGNSNVDSNRPYAGPNGALPQNRINPSLNTSGDQLFAYQLYQQAVNAATPTNQQLDAISGNAVQQTGNGPQAQQLKGGVSSEYAPYNVLSDNGPQIYSSEYQAVNLGNPRAEAISACAQNAPTFIATSLLPKPTIPGQQSWDIGAPQNILANQNFLSATQQLGVDTVLSSNRNPSHDLRNNIPNPIAVVSPWQNSTILPDLERKPLDCFIPETGLYSCSTSGGCNANGSFIGK